MELKDDALEGVSGGAGEPACTREEMLERLERLRDRKPSDAQILIEPTEGGKAKQDRVLEEVLKLYNK